MSSEQRVETHGIATPRGGFFPYFSRAGAERMLAHYEPGSRIVMVREVRDGDPSPEAVAGLEQAATNAIPMMHMAWKQYGVGGMFECMDALRVALAPFHVALAPPAPSAAHAPRESADDLVAKAESIIADRDKTIAELRDKLKDAETERERARKRWDDHQTDSQDTLTVYPGIHGESFSCTEAIAWAQDEITRLRARAAIDGKGGVA